MLRMFYVLIITLFMLIWFTFYNTNRLISIKIVCKDANENIIAVQLPFNLLLISLFQRVENQKILSVLTYSINGIPYQINLEQINLNKLVKNEAYIQHDNLYYRWKSSDNDDYACLVYDEYDVAIEQYRPGRMCINGKLSPPVLDLN